MPKTKLADDLHATKYRAKGETFRDWANRVAAALKDDDEHFWALREVLLDQRFLPAGRVQAAAGSPRRVTAFNCYVSGTIADSFTDGEGSIMQRAAEAAQTMRMGGGIGYDFSTLRPRGTRIKTLDSKASGPVDFMGIFDAVCRVTSSAGNRRGAQMGVLRVDHPDILEFVRAKHDLTRLTGFNVSVAVTDHYMRCVETGEPFTLTWGGRDYGQVDPRALWEEIMRSTWDNAEPGVLFVDTINRTNNLYYCETIAATNPCGEQPLPPYGACLLGSVNLTKYVVAGKEFNLLAMREDLVTAYRAMDNVIDRTVYPLPQQEAEAKAKRRMGIGVTGLANALEAMGHPYGSDGFLELEGTILREVRDTLYRASALRARDKGSFPRFQSEAYLDGEFVERLPADVRDLIAKHGLRNSHLTSVAPTGTISLCADNVSSGIEPVYRHSVQRTVLGEEGPEVHELEDYALRTWGVRGRTAEEATLDEHLAVLGMAQRFVDSAVSKTINVPRGTSWEDFKAVYTKAWKLGCKGCTTFNPEGRRQGIFVEPKKNEEGQACRIDPETGARTCDE